MSTLPSSRIGHGVAISRQGAGALFVPAPLSPPSLGERGRGHLRFLSSPKVFTLARTPISKVV